MTDAEVRIKRPKTCFFILSKRKDITDQLHHYPIFRKYETRVSWVKISYIRGVRFRFWCWSRLSMLKKDPELAWTTANFLWQLRECFSDVGNLVEYQKANLCPVNCAHLVCSTSFCKLVPPYSIFQGYGVFGFIFCVKLDSGCWKKCLSYVIFIQQVTEFSRHRKSG